MISKYESMAKKQLREEGWIVDWKIRARMPMRSYTCDFWGAFDIMVYKPGIIRLISVKGHAYVPSKHRRLLESFVFPPGVVKELWVYHLDKTVKREIIN